MGVFYHEEPPNPCSKRCKFIAATLKEKFCNCHHFDKRLPISSPAEEEYEAGNFDDEQEVVVSAIRSGAMEKLKRKPRFKTDSFTCLFSPSTGELYIAQKAVHKKENNHDKDQQKLDEDQEDNNEEKLEFHSVKSYFSRCSSCSAAVDREEFFSVRTNLSRSSSLNDLDIQRIDFEEFWRRWSIIEELCHCEGWPFGLCRKAVFLPPLPKSPSESWTWSKGTRLVKLPPV